MAIDHRYDQLTKLRDFLSILIHPIQTLAELPITGAAWVSENLTTQDQLQLENERLKRELLISNSRLLKYESLLAENIRLRDLLQSSFKIEDRILIAELSAVDLDPYHHQIQIKKGTSSGVYNGQPVLDAHGVMGQVVNTNSLSSMVLLITDVKHSIPVQVLRNGLRSIAVGTGHLNRLEIPYLPGNADIKAGDSLVTSGLGGKFPPGYPVAKITSVRQSPGKAFLDVIAEPLAPLATTREVLLVWSLAPPEEIPEEENTETASENIPAADASQRAAIEAAVP